MIKLHPEDLERLDDGMGEKCEEWGAAIAENPSSCDKCLGSGRKLVALGAYRLEYQPEEGMDFNIILAGRGAYFGPNEGGMSYPLPISSDRHIVAEEWLYNKRIGVFFLKGNQKADGLSPFTKDIDGNIAEGERRILDSEWQPSSTMPESLARYTLVVVDVGEVKELIPVAGESNDEPGYWQLDACAYLEKTKP